MSVDNGNVRGMCVVKRHVSFCFTNPMSFPSSPLLASTTPSLHPVPLHISQFFILPLLPSLHPYPTFVTPPLFFLLSLSPTLSSSSSSHLPSSSRRHTESSRDGYTMTQCTTWRSRTSSPETGCHCGCGEGQWRFRQHTQQSLQDCGTKGTPCSAVVM